MTTQDVTPITPQSTPMKAKHVSTPLPSVNSPSKPTKDLPQTPTLQTPQMHAQAQVNKVQPQIPGSPRSPQTPMKGQPQPPTPTQQPATLQSPVRERTWYDRLADAILGDDPSSTSGDISQKYALICEKCAKHNGLVPREQYIELQWECRFCQHMNLSPRRKALARTLQGGNSASSTRRPSPLSQEPSRLGEEPEKERTEEKEKKKPLPLPSKNL